jgi:hypothetical protein
MSLSNIQTNGKKLHESFPRAPLRYKIKPNESLERLRTAQNNPEIESSAQIILDKLFPSDKQNSEKLNQDVTVHLQKLADKCLQKN